MSSQNVTSKTAKKNIRFPHELIEEINTSVERDNSNFSSWVIDACEKKLKTEKRKAKQSDS